MDSWFILSSFDSMDIFYTIVYGIIVLVIIFPTTEFITAGVTLENMFYKFLGNEDTYFIQYHLRRTMLIRSISSLLVLFYFIYMQHLSSDAKFSSPNITFPFTVWDIILWIGLAIPSYVLTYNYFVCYNGGTWSGHPTICELRKYLRTELSNEMTSEAQNLHLERLISQINMECRSHDKFISGFGHIENNWPGCRFLVTDNWILASHRMKFQLIKQSPSDLIGILASSLSVLDVDSLSPTGRPDNENMGFRTMIAVKFIESTSGICLLKFSISANNLDELRSKLQCPLIHAKGFSLEPSIVHRFIEAFTKVVQENGIIKRSKDMNLDQCIGCMTEQANVKLIKHCELTSSAQVGLETNNTTPVICGDCNCQPFWCLHCLARWFASRQIHAEHPPTEWLSGRVLCPTCRSIFCVRDVFEIE